MTSNRIVNTFKLRYPIIQAPMAGGATTPQLVIAVSNAGGLGSLGGAYLTPAALREDIRKIKSLTKQPFCVNLFVPQSFAIEAHKIKSITPTLNKFRQELSISEFYNEPTINIDNQKTFQEQLAVLIEEEVGIVSFVFGIPDSKTMDSLKNANITLIGTATNVREGILLEQAGFDFVVAQGSEAGGHRGGFDNQYRTSLIGSMALIPQMVSTINKPVIAAGGIMDGRGLIAALSLGATCVQMGTAFLTCNESGIQQHYKEKILNSNEESTVLTSVFSGKPARGIKNKFIEEVEKMENHIPDFPVQHHLTQDIRKESTRQNNTEFMSLWAGQGTRLSRSLSAAELIENIMQEAEIVNRENVSRLNLRQE